MNYFIERKIPFYYLYDDRGSQLYEEITKLEEYYPYMKEEELLLNNITEIINIEDDQITQGITLVELGAGYSTKTEIILNTLLKKYKKVKYIPIDVSECACKVTYDKYCNKTGLEISPYVGTYDDYLEAKNTYKNRVVYLWLGSSIGNLDRLEQVSIMKKLESVMSYRDFLLIGFDTIYKEVEVIEKAYNDDKGVTAEFIMNILTHVKRKYNLKLEEKDFRYSPKWNDKLQRVEMYLECVRDTCVIDLKSKANDLQENIPNDIQLKMGEKIFIEASHKFSTEFVEERASMSNLEVFKTWMTDDKYFMMSKFIKSVKGLWDMTDHIFKNIIKHENFYKQPISLRNPFIFYIGHIYAFYDIKIFSLSKEDTFHELFERGRDPIINNTNDCHRHSNFVVKYPTIEVILKYNDIVKKKLMELIQEKGYTYNIMVSMEHEIMHQETLLYMTRISDCIFPISLPSKYTIPIKNIINIPRRKVIRGTSETFAWDNESPELIKEVDSFKVDNLPITWDDMLGFIQENSYLIEDKIINLDSNYQIRITSSQWIDFDQGRFLPAWVSLEVAQLYIEWMNNIGLRCRIMTEEEFDSLASKLKSTKKGNSELINYHAMPIGYYNDYSEDGVGELFGNGWELTSSKFMPFPGFKPMDVYAEYSTDFFTDHHYVIKGAGPFTRSSLCRKSFRNWYQYNYPYHTSKFRLVYY